MLEDPREKRLKELSRLDFPSDQELEEYERLKEELNISIEDTQVIEPIMQQRKQDIELQNLISERKNLEKQLRIKRERERVEKVKNLLDDKVYCKACDKSVEKSHFTLDHLYKGKVWCDDCERWVDPSHFE